MARISGDKNVINYKPTIQLFEAPSWCGHCKNFSPIWQQLQEIKTTRENDKQIIKANEIINFESYDDNHQKTKDEDIKMFPTLKFIINGEKYDYTGQRTHKEMLAFMLDKLNQKQN